MRKFARYAWDHIVDHLLVTALAVLLTTSLIEISFSVSFLNPMARSLSNFSMTDIFYDISKTKEQKEQSDLITLVDMSEVFERGKLADIITEIDSLNPVVLGIDVVFDGVRDDTLGNERLMDAALGVRNHVVWSCKLTDWSDDKEQFCSTTHSFFADLCGIDEGFTNVQRDVNGGTVRRFGVLRRAEDKWVYSMPAKIAKIYTSEEPSSDAEMSCAINFHAVDFPVVPYDKIKENADLINGRIVLLGATDDVRDMHYTPLGLISGLHVLAYTVKTLVDHQAPTELPAWLIILLSLLVTLFTQMAQSYAFDATVRHRLGSVECLGRMGVTSSVIFFAVVIILVDASFMLYMRDNVNLDVKWAIMCTALLGTARLFYSVIINLTGDYAWPRSLRRVAEKSIYRYESRERTKGKIDVQQSTLEL